MASRNGIYTLEEYLALTNKEIVSNNSRLRSVICLHEPQITWHEATTKAQELKETGKVNEYLDAVRADFRQAEEKKSTIEPPTDFGSGIISNLTIYQKNYDRLTLVAPGLDLKLRNYNGEYVYGKAVKTGYLDFYLEVLHHKGNKFYIGISQYDKIESGKLVPAPDMEIVLDIQKRTVEALKYKDANKDIEVYQNTEGRKFTDKAEKRSQNRFLGDWLKNLRNRGQKVKWSKKDSKDVSESFIVDHYKKEDLPQETKLHIVSPVEEPKKADEKPKPEEKEEIKDNADDPELAKIIPLKAGYTEKERQEILERFMRVVTLNHRKNFKTLASEALSIINGGKTIPFLLDSWDKLKDREYNHLIELNYFRLNAIVPNLLERLEQEGGTIRLISSKTKTAFRIELGDDRKENSVVLGISQMNKKKPEPTLLVKIHKDKGTITTDLSVNGFAGLTDFNADAESRYFEPKYESALGFERWLKYLVLQGFEPLSVNMKKVEAPAIEEEETPKEEKHSKYYINKDIPHMEPGHGWLTEAHKKHGVTQKMIDWINKNDKPMVVIPRKKIMVHNTVDPKADIKRQALAPGLRLSRNFLFYPEGRSNRADRTRDGY